MMQRAYRSLTPYVHHPLAFPVLIALVFIESIIFVPSGPLFSIFCLERPDKAARYAFYATIASILGGMVAYFIGCYLFTLFGNLLLNHFAHSCTFNRLFTLYQQHGSYAAFVTCITPFPYKLVTLSAGFCHMALLPFTIAITAGRSIRFFTLALLLRRFGPQIQEIINSYFNYIIVIAAAITAASFWLIR